MATVRETEDLLDDPKSQYEVRFDIPTPRPHFVFLSKRPGYSFQDWDKKRTEEDERQLLYAVNQFCHKKEITDATFSLHRGLWASNHQKFHAHLLVDKEQYLQIFEDEKITLSRSQVTKQWKKSPKPEDYALNVEAYPFTSYHQQDLDDIRKLDASPTQQDELPGSLLDLVWHNSLPRLGFKISRREADHRVRQADILRRIDTFAESLGLIDRSRGGCHVCLVIGRGGTSGLTFPEEVKGYIEMSALKYYKLRPQHISLAWKAEFAKMQKYCPLT